MTFGVSAFTRTLYDTRFTDSFHSLNLKKLKHAINNEKISITKKLLA